MRYYIERGFQGVLFLGFTLLFILPLLLYSDIVYPYTTTKTFLFRAVVDVLFLCCLLHHLYDSSTSWRDSWIARMLLIFLLCATLSAFYGVDPNSSFYGSYSRMDGVIQLLHLIMYFFILSYCVRDQKKWNYWAYSSIFIAATLVIQALVVHKISHSANGLSGLIGNTGYLATYLLFQIFWLAYLMPQTKRKYLRYALYLISILFIYALFCTAARGVILGLLTGIIVAGIFLINTNEAQKKHRWLLSLGLIVLSCVITLVVCYLCFSYWELVPVRAVNWFNNYTFGVRSKLWLIAWNAIKEAPWLGWGMNNFNYSYNFYYIPSLYGEEMWFDRAHNIFLDWFVSGGIIGLLSYLGLLTTVIYSLCSAKGKASFSAWERALLLGLIAGYVVQNLFTFDYLLSYINFFTILALIHTRIGWPLITSVKIPNLLKYGCIAPALSLMCMFYLSQIMLPEFLAARDIIISNNISDARSCYTRAHRALERSTNDFGHQEAFEHILNMLGLMYQQKALPPEELAQYIQSTVAQAQAFLSQHMQNTRMHYHLGSFAIKVGDISLANEEFIIARRLSPQRQEFILEQGAVALLQNDPDTALQLFKTAYDLDQSNQKALKYYNTLAGYLKVQPLPS